MTRASQRVAVNAAALSQRMGLSVTDLDERMDTAESDIDALETTVGEIDTRVSAVEAELAGP